MKNKLWVGILVIAATTAWAQNAPVENPPSRVARLNLIQGRVSFQPATLADWTAATLNYPFTIGDHLYADADSRAELHIGSTAIRLGPAGAMSFLNLDDHQVQIRLDQGALIVRVKNLDADDACEIDTAQGAVTILRPGEYRIDTDPDHNTTKVTVRDGDAAVTSNSGGFPVHVHQTANFVAEAQPQFQAENSNDTFDTFALEQDKSDDSMGVPRFVPRELPGWQDLDRSGSWSQDPTYGPVWKPAALPAGWAPYRDGSWAWVQPWGWTWIDDAPWGFAPFHYGRWALVSNTWEWVPGLMPPHPIYAPALVVFAGIKGFGTTFGAGEGATPGSGAVAWFPLGPREIFVPSYPVTSLYVDKINSTTVNINNVTVVNHDYMNQTAGMTAVDTRTFVMAQPVQKSIVKVPPEIVAHAEILRAASATPQRASVLAHAVPVDAPHPPESVMQRTVFAQTTPPPAAAPFTAKPQPQQATPSNLTRPPEPKAETPAKPATQATTTAAQAPPSPAPPLLAPPASPVHTLPPSPVTARPTPPPAPPAPVTTLEDPKPVVIKKTAPPRPTRAERVEKEKPAVPDHPLTKEEKAELAKKKRAEEIKKAEENDR